MFQKFWKVSNFKNSKLINHTTSLIFKWKRRKEWSRQHWASCIGRKWDRKVNMSMWILPSCEQLKFVLKNCRSLWPTDNYAVERLEEVSPCHAPDLWKRKGTYSSCYNTQPRPLVELPECAHPSEYTPICLADMLPQRSSAICADLRKCIFMFWTRSLQ